MNRFSRAFEDDPAAFGEALLGHARGDRPSPQARACILARVAGAGVAGSGAGLLAASVAKQGATVSSAKVGALVVTKWAFAGAVLATAALGVRAAVVSDDDAAPPSHVEPAAKPNRASGPTRAAPADRAVELAPSTEPSAEAAVEPSEMALGSAARELPLPEWSPARSTTSSSRTGRAVRGEQRIVAPVDRAPALTSLMASSAVPSRDAGGGLSREIESLDRARTRLAQHSPDAALEALDDYERGFPVGVMKVEASALRVEALVESGRYDEAARLGRAFLAAHARNPMADRVRTFLARLEAAPGRP